jgi:hypothetical protein
MVGFSRRNHQLYALWRIDPFNLNVFKVSGVPGELSRSTASGSPHRSDG